MPAPPATNATVPPVGAGEIVAVNVSSTFLATELALVDILVAVAPGMTFWLIAGDSLAAAVGSPENLARIDFTPVARIGVLQEATPSRTSTASQPGMATPSATNATVPPT